MPDDALADLSRLDKDRYLSLLFAPPESRGGLAALYLFNAELDKIERQVSEPQLGSIRLQWWREAVERLADVEPAEHPVARALHPVVRSTGMPAEGLLAMIDAREQAIHRDTPETLEALEAHLGQSSSMLMQLAVLVLGGSAPDAAGLAGVAYGLARLLHGSQRWFVPAAMREELGDEVALNTLAGHAQRRLIEARKQPFDRALLPAFLAAATVPAYLAAVARNMQRPPPVSPLRRQAAIWWAARHNRF